MQIPPGVAAPFHIPRPSPAKPVASQTSIYATFHQDSLPETARGMGRVQIFSGYRPETMELSHRASCEATAWAYYRRGAVFPPGGIYGMRGRPLEVAAAAGWAGSLGRCCPWLQSAVARESPGHRGLTSLNVCGGAGGGTVASRLEYGAVRRGGARERRDDQKARRTRRRRRTSCLLYPVGRAAGARSPGFGSGQAVPIGLVGARRRAWGAVHDETGGVAWRESGRHWRRVEA